MIPVLTYLLVCSAVAGGLTVLWTFTRPMRTRDEVHSGRALLVFVVLAHVAPFAYVELLTKMVGQDLYAGVVEGYQEAPIDGPMEYYRVLWKRGDRAKALVVGSEKEDWGGNDRPVLWVMLDRENGEWKPTSYEIAYSAKLNRETVVFPPYR